MNELNTFDYDEYFPAAQQDVMIYNQKINEFRKHLDISDYNIYSVVFIPGTNQGAILAGIKCVNHDIELQDEYTIQIIQFRFVWTFTGWQYTELMYLPGSTLESFPSSVLFPTHPWKTLWITTNK